MKRKNGWWLIAFGVAVLAYTARPLPAFWMPPMMADRWLRATMGDPSGGMGTAIALYWMCVEVPIGTLGGLALLLGGVTEVRK